MVDFADLFNSETDIIYKENLEILVNQDINLFNDDGESLLYFAAKKGFLLSTKFLLEKGADPNITNEQNELPQEYWRPKCYKIPLGQAVENGFTELVECLLVGKADPNIHYKSSLLPIYHAAKKGFIEIIKLLIDHGSYTRFLFQCPPIHMALLENKTECAEYLLSQVKDDDNEYRFHLIDYSMINFKIHITKYIIDNCCNKFDINWTTENGWSIIHSLSNIIAGNTNIGRVNGILEMTLYILDKFPLLDINLQNNIGQTALHFQLNNVALKKLLMIHGGDPDIEDEYGDSPRSLAVKHNYRDMIELFNSYPKIVSLRSLCLRIIYREKVDRQEFPTILFKYPNEFEEDEGYNKRMEKFRT